MHASCGESLWTLRVAPDSIFVTDQVIVIWCALLAWGREEGAGLRLFRSPDIRRWLLTGTVLLCALGGGAIAPRVEGAYAGSSLEERKMPMKFSWIACQPDCPGWVSAVGIVTADSPAEFEAFARNRKLEGVTMVLDSSGGSVNDSIALGRRIRGLGMRTTVGTSIQIRSAQGDRTRVMPEAYCESMCVYLLLAGNTRYVPPAAHVRVHQIWMGDRADDAKASSYTAQDLMIVERDIGRLAKYTFDMGGAGDLLLLSLNVPPWEDLHELSQSELKLTNLVTTESVAEVFPRTTDRPATSVAGLPPKQVQDRVISETVEVVPAAAPQVGKATKTAEAVAPTGGAAVPLPPK